MTTTTPWWGSDLRGVATRPVTLNKPHRVAYSPHEYGQSVGAQPWLTSGNEWKMRDVWMELWSYILSPWQEFVAPIWIGETGGKFGVDGHGQPIPSFPTEAEKQWMQYLVQFIMGTAGNYYSHTLISFAWWSFNPNSADTGGLVRDDWETPQQVKLDLIAPLMPNQGQEP